MIAQKTELWTEEKLNNYLDDIKAFIDKVYLEKIHLVLKDANGKQIKARGYYMGKVNSNHTTDRPGANNWDQYGGTSLNVVISHGYEWNKLSQEERKQFKSERKIGWSPSKEDLEFKHLVKKQDKLYSSGDFGIERNEFG